MFSITPLLPNFLQPVYLFFFIVAGAAALEMLSMRKDFQGAVDWLRRNYPEMPPAKVNRLNTLIVMILGPLLAAILIQPATEAQAIGAGLGWVGLVNTAAKPD